MTKVPKAEMAFMFQMAGVDQEKLHDSLRRMSPQMLKNKVMKEQWSEDNPTRNWCYTVSEFLYWYLADPNSKVCTLRVPNETATHWFLEYPGGYIVDLTCDQFEDYSLVDYSKAKFSFFLQTANKGPSFRAKHLAGLMGITELPAKEAHATLNME